VTDPHALLDLAFGPDPPASILRLLGTDPVSRYGAGPILSAWDDHRFYIAARHAPERWHEALSALAPGAVDWLQDAPEGTRRVLDTDGRSAEVILDDLHLDGSNIMCRVWTPRGEESYRRVHAPPPSFRRLSELEGFGMLAHRQGTLEHLLWIPEGRTPERAEAAVALARALDLLPGAFPDGASIDGIEVRSDGGVFLTPVW